MRRDAHAWGVGAVGLSGAVRGFRGGAVVGPWALGRWDLRLQLLCCHLPSVAVRRAVSSVLTSSHSRPRYTPLRGVKWRLV